MDVMEASFVLLEAPPTPPVALANDEVVRVGSPLPSGHPDPKHSQEGSPNESVEQKVPIDDTINREMWSVMMNTHRHRSTLRCCRHIPDSQVDNSSQGHQGMVYSQFGSRFDG